MGVLVALIRVSTVSNTNQVLEIDGLNKLTATCSVDGVVFDDEIRLVLYL
jgi:hypothetical protein